LFWNFEFGVDAGGPAAVIVQIEPKHMHSVPSATAIQTTLLLMSQMPNLELPLHTRVPGAQARGQRLVEAEQAATTAMMPNRDSKVVIFMLIL
jgi:hypothetical protein